MHLSADHDRCMGAGQCVLTAPDLFDADDDGLVVVLDADPAPDRRPAAEEAVRLCPNAALRLDG